MLSRRASKRTRLCEILPPPDWYWGSSTGKILANSYYDVLSTTTTKGTTCTMVQNTGRDFFLIFRKSNRFKKPSTMVTDEKRMIHNNNQPMTHCKRLEDALLPPFIQRQEGERSMAARILLHRQSSWQPSLQLKPDINNRPLVP
jgi:hypothetical protein